MDEKRNHLKKRVLISLLVLCALLVGCGEGQINTGQNMSEESVDTGFILAAPGNYDSVDTAILVSKNTEEETITLLNQETGKRYTLNYDGATYFYDKYDEAIALSLIGEGAIVNVTFMKEKKRLNSMKQSAESFSYKDITNHELDLEENIMLIGKDVYSIDENVYVYSGDSEIDLEMIHTCDQITIEGFDRNIESVRVEKGHGYLSLMNDEHFIGGWIEVGKTSIQMISEGMIITIPEGTYQVQISSGSSGGVKEVIIERNKEVKLDISDLNIEETKIGGIIFTVSPAEASVFIDGEEVDISGIVDMEYGIHQMLVTAEGYVSVAQYLKVGASLATINVTLDPEEAPTPEPTETPAESASTTNTTTDTSQSSTMTGDTVTSTTDDTGNGTVTTTYTVMIETPEGAEVYVDGTYVGIAPTSFPKVSGEHIITLRKTGYQTRTYTLNIGTEEKSVNYSFSDLVAID